MKLLFAPAATRGIRRIPAKDAAALLAVLKEIAADPFALHARAKKMTDHPGFRARYGEWRAVYRLDREACVMMVDRIGHRSEVYR